MPSQAMNGFLWRWEQLRSSKVSKNCPSNLASLLGSLTYLGYNSLVFNMVGRAGFEPAKA